MSLFVYRYQNKEHNAIQKSAKLTLNTGHGNGTDNVALEDSI